jgi:putative ABC transport system permease protein
MLARLALGNVRANVRDFAVYFVTLALGVAVFYAFNTVAVQAAFFSTSVSEMLQLAGQLIRGVTVFLAAVLGFLMVYANGYLMRRRKRELALYQVLGMRRGQVAAVVALETLAVSAASFMAGLGAGVLLSQLLVFVTAALFHDQVTTFTFVFSTDAFVLTLACFGAMYAVMLLFNLRTVGRTRLVELMGAHRRAERAVLRRGPVALALLAAGCALVGVAYARLLRDGLPVAAEPSAAWGFAATTGLVTAGTFLFFWALANGALVLVRRLPGLYWSGLNMFTARQLAARVNSSAASMGVIALILFLAITSMATGMGVCTTLSNNVTNKTPCDATVEVTCYTEDGLATYVDDGAARAVPDPQTDFAALLAANGWDLAQVGSVFQLETYDAAGLLDDVDLLNMTMPEFCAAVGVDVPLGYEDSSVHIFGSGVMSLGTYNAWRAWLGLEPVELADDEYLFTTDLGSTTSDFLRAVAEAGTGFSIAGRYLSPAGVVDDLGSSVSAASASGSNPGMLVVPDELVEGAALLEVLLNVDYSVDVEEGDAFVGELANSGSENLWVLPGGEQVGVTTFAATRSEMWEALAGLSGIVSYLAVYIGFVLVVSCAAILAVQQLTAAAESAPRYRVLSELGAPARMVWRSLLAQTCVAFALPLAVGMAHAAVALSVTRSLVQIFGDIDLAGSIGLVVGLFAAVYGGYLLVTYRASRAVVAPALVRGA